MTSRKQPFRAIVKDLIIENVSFIARIAKKMLLDLRRMRSFEVYNMDIQARNYKDERLVNFSVAMITPHYLFVIKSAWRKEDYQYDDLRSFDYMLDEAEIVTLNRATPNRECLSKLRPRDNKGRVIKQTSIRRRNSPVTAGMASSRKRGAGVDAAIDGKAVKKGKTGDEVMSGQTR